METHNCIFIQIIWCIFGYDVIQSRLVASFFYKKVANYSEQSSRRILSAVGAYWNPCHLYHKILSPPLFVKQFWCAHISRHLVFEDNNLHFIADLLFNMSLNKKI